MISSCEQEIAISQVQVSRKVVVNSTFSPQTEFEVALSYSFLKTDQSGMSEKIEDARVTMFDDKGNYLFELEHTENGVYTKEDLLPNADKVYNLEVRVVGFEPITASSRVPAQVEVTNVVTTEIEVNGESALQVDFDIMDAEDTDNYYIWEVVSTQEYTGSFIDTESEPEYNPSFQSISDTESFQNIGSRWSKLFVSDLDFDGSTHKTSFISFPGRNIVGVGDSSDNDQVNIQTRNYLKVTTASNDLYDYYLGIEQYLNQREINSSAIVPVKLHSNINGGLGIFAGFNEQLIEI